MKPEIPKLKPFTSLIPGDKFFFFLRIRLLVLQNENVMLSKGNREQLKVLEKKGVNAETIIKGQTITGAEAEAET